MVSHIDMITAMVAPEKIPTPGSAVKALAALALQLLVFCGAVALLLDTHGPLFVRGLPLMTVEDRAITAAAVAGTYWLMLGGLLLAVSWMTARSPGAVAGFGAVGLGIAAFVAVWWAADVLFFLAHHACYTADWCEAHPIFAHLMHALAATSLQPGAISLLVVSAFAAIAFVNSRRRWRNPTRFNGAQ